MQKLLFYTLLVLTLLVSAIPSWAAVYYSDTDGDGYTETVTTNTNNITIFHPRTNITSTYPLSVSSYAINKIIDTDGIAGNEIVVIYTDIYGSGIRVINDKNQVVHQYQILATGTGGSFSINSVIDTDSIAGNDLVVIYAGAYGSGIKVINDKNQVVHQYQILGAGASGSFAINKIIDTDGIAGNNIVVVYADAYGSGIKVINDVNQVIHQYQILVAGAGGSFAINSIIDTEGILGNEIVVVYASSSGNGTKVIHDSSQTVHQYALSASTSFAIMNVTNYDGILGAEICYSWNTSYSSGYSLIIDRTGVVQSRSGC